MADLSLPPQNIEAEEAVLGSLLIDPEAALRIAPFLKHDMFYVVKNGWIYDSILQLQERREAIDLLTVSSELAKDNRLDEIGGESYLAQLVNTVPTALNVETYAHIVEEMATRRRMLSAASEIARIAYDKTTPIDQVVEKSEAAVFAVTEGSGDGQMVVMRQAVNNFFERIEYLHDHRDEPLGIPTGYPDLDKLTGGMNRGDLIIVAARPGVGKTSLMLNLAYNAAFRHRQRVAIFSLEMGVEQLVQRMMNLLQPEMAASNIIFTISPAISTAKKVFLIKFLTSVSLNLTPCIATSLIAFLACNPTIYLPSADISQTL